VEEDEKAVITDAESGNEEESDEEKEDDDEVKEEQTSGDDIKEEPESDDEEYTDLDSNCSGLTDISGLSDIGEELVADETPEGLVDAGISPKRKKQKVGPGFENSIISLI
jgi:hypothetical protein